MFVYYNYLKELYKIIICFFGFFYTFLEIGLEIKAFI